MEEEKNGLTADKYTKDELTYTQYKKQKQTELLDADEELQDYFTIQEDGWAQLIFPNMCIKDINTPCRKVGMKWRECA